MGRRKIYRAVGLMSGTSLDGVDAALIETDGFDHIHPLGFVSLPYDDETRAKIYAVFMQKDRTARDVLEAERLLTLKHVEAVKAVLKGEGADVVGFHGQTIFHDPAQKLTIQIGDGALLAKETGIDTVADFRSADVAAGGQGAPLLPLYHEARVRAENLPLPLAVLNIGGVANVTYIKDKILAFDTGPGGALMDDFMFSRTGERFDADGALARAGKPDKGIIDTWMATTFFTKPLPKSLDRNHWSIDAVKNLSTEDGLATLGAFTVEAVKAAAKMLPEKPRQWLVTGGGRHNQFLMDQLQFGLFAPVKPVEDFGWNGDALEAEGFAWLAVRSLLGEPLSIPETTGVPKPLTGGVLFKA